MKTTSDSGFTPSLFISAIVAALAGMLFGFDTAVIAGVERTLANIYHLSEWGHGFTMSIALIGTMMGAIFSSIPGDKLGRRDSLKITGMLFLVSAIGCAIAWDWYSLLFFRFIGGIAIGAASVLAPMYIAEIAPAAWRGRLVMCFQINIVGGILLAYLSNYIVDMIGFDVNTMEWRVKLGVEAFPSLLFFVLLYFIPRSPRWLVKSGLTDEAKQTLAKIGEPNPEEELEAIRKSLFDDEQLRSASLMRRAYMFPIILAFTIAMFNQLSGINGILYYLNSIFEEAGFGKVSSAGQAVIIGATNLVFTLIAMTLIDRFGRKTLLLIGAVGTSLALAATAWIFFADAHKDLLVYALVVYIAFFALSQGAVIWVYISEIFPNSVRAKGQSFGSATHWVFAALVAQFLPLAFKFSTCLPFVFFFAMTVIQFFVVLFVFPETKGLPLEEIQKKMAGAIRPCTPTKRRS